MTRRTRSPPQPWIVQGNQDEYVPCIRARLLHALSGPKHLEILDGADHRFTKPADFQQMLTFAHGLDFAPHRGVAARSRQKYSSHPVAGTPSSTKFYGSTVHPSKADVEGFSFSDCSNFCTRKIEQRIAWQISANRLVTRHVLPIHRCSWLAPVAP